jgi:hypothetical protein
MEYSQLKEKPTKVLVIHYCNYDRFAKHYQDSFDRYREIYMDGMTKGLPASVLLNPRIRMDEDSALVDQCNQSKLKVMDALSDRSDYSLDCIRK